MKSTYLMHHGIKGQKWGIRRYENEDGSLTEEGKKRYSKSRKIASSIYKNSEALEPRITNDVSNAIEKSGAQMYGLDHRLKTQDSLERKIYKDSKEKGVSIRKAAEGINDSIRYTSLTDDNNFVSSYNKVKQELSKKGYKEEKCKNYFDLYKQGKTKHKQVTSVFSDKDGNRFEIQFQTPSSIKAKELKTPLYEESRKLGIDQNRKDQLIRQMEKLAEDVKDPKDIYKILSHSDWRKTSTRQKHVLL